MLVLLLVLGIPGRAIAAGSPSLTIRVVDDAGRALSGASIFLLASAKSLRPAPEPAPWEGQAPARPALLETVTTDAQGVAEARLPIGRYRVGAFKPGYDLALSEVSTLSRSNLEIRLRAAARAILGDLPAAAEPEGLDLGWVLREGSDDVLREAEARLPERSEDEPSQPARGGRLNDILGGLDGELVQHFSGDDLLGQEAPDAGSSGRSTSLALRGAIGDQGSWRFHGLTGRQENGSAEGLGSVRQGRRADRIQIGADYHLGPDSSLTGDLHYGTSRYVLDPSGDTINATDQDQTDLGMEARWDRRIGAVALLYVEGSYAQTGVRVVDDGLSPFASPVAGGAEPKRVLDRSTLTTAGVTFDAEHHHLDFGVRAKSYRYDLRDQGVLLYTLYDSPSLAEPGERGNAMTVFGSDDWRVAPRATLTYGLRYHSNLTAGDASIVPRVGMTFQSLSGGPTVRAVALYRLDDPGIVSLYTSADEPDGAMGRQLGRFGYLLSVERRPEHRLQMSARLSYKPFEEGIGEDDAGLLAPGAWGDALLFLTDGAASRHEMGVEVGRAFGGLHGFLSGTVGRVGGRLSPAMEEAPVQMLSVGEVRYSVTRLRAMYAPTSTEVQVDYRRVDAASSALSEGSGDSDGIDYRRLDLTVAQDLPRLRNLMNARFRVLMAYQGLTYGASTAATAPAATTRLTGGVDIRF